MKILALGNSFSEDCTAYLERMTKEAVKVRNLYVGGCSLARHEENLKNAKAEYELQQNGVMLGDTLVSANFAIRSEIWDVITVQEVSGGSGKYEEFSPHLAEVLTILHTMSPNARIVWNQTWAYAPNSTHPRFADYGYDTDRMFSMIEAASHRVTEEHGLDLIQTGRAIQALRREMPDIENAFCRDGFHLSLTYGRYAAAYTWARYFGLSVNDFLPDGADAERIRSIREILDREKAK